MVTRFSRDLMSQGPSDHARDVTSALPEILEITTLYLLDNMKNVYSIKSQPIVRNSDIKLTSPNSFFL